MPKYNINRLESPVLKSFYPENTWELPHWTGWHYDETTTALGQKIYTRYLAGKWIFTKADEYRTLGTLDEAIRCGMEVAIAINGVFVDDVDEIARAFKPVEPRGLEIPPEDPNDYRHELMSIQKYAGGKEMADNLNKMVTIEDFKRLLETSFVFLQKFKHYAYRGNDHIISYITRDLGYVVEWIYNQHGESMFPNMPNFEENENSVSNFKEILLSLVDRNDQGSIHSTFFMWFETAKKEANYAIDGETIAHIYANCPITIPDGLTFPSINYHGDSEGRIWAMEKLVSPKGIFVIGQSTNVNGMEDIQYQVAFQTPTLAWKILTMTALDWADKRRLGAYMAKGFPGSPAVMGNIAQYLADFIDKNGVRIPQTKFYTNMGWTDNFEGFVWGDHLITADGIEDIPVRQDEATAEITRHYTQKGTLSEWYNGVFIPAAGENLDNFGFLFSLGTGMASVIGKILHRPTGFISNLYSKTSSGKSTTVRAALSAFCEPVEGDTFLGWESKYAGVEARCNFNQNLPIVLDDTSQVKDFKGISSVIYLIANGTGRNRGDISKSGIGKSRKWSLNTMSSAEFPLKTYAESSGSETRIFDIGIGPGEKFTENLASANAINENVHEFYGSLFPAFMEEVVKDASNEETMKQEISVIRGLQKLLVEFVMSEPGSEHRDINVLSRNAEACAMVTYSVEYAFHTLQRNGLLDEEKRKSASQTFINNVGAYLLKIVPVGMDHDTRTVDWLRDMSVANSSMFWVEGTNKDTPTNGGFWGWIEPGSRDSISYFWIQTALDREVKKVAEAKGISVTGVLSTCLEKGIYEKNPKGQEHGGKWPKNIKGTVWGHKFTFKD